MERLPNLNGTFAEQLRTFLEGSDLTGRKLKQFLAQADIDPELMKRWKRGAQVPSAEKWNKFCSLARRIWPTDSEQAEALASLDEQFRTDRALVDAAQRSGKKFEIRDQHRTTASSAAPRIGGKAATPGTLIRPGLKELIAEAGLSAFYPSREYYSRYREASTIDQYVSTATCSVVMVSINLMTGIPIDGVCEALIAKLKKDRKFSATISLLNPELAHLMATLAPVLSVKPVDLAHSIQQSLTRLMDERAKLSQKAQERFSIRVHDTIPMGSAILLDHRESFGRIQIESKVYKAAPRMSFAFEVVRTGSAGFYDTLAKGYDDLVADGHNWPINHSEKENLTPTAG